MEAEDARSLHREVRTLTKECTRPTNRIKGLLMSQGVRLEKVGWDFLQRLDRMRLWDGSPLPPGLWQRIERESERWQLTHRQLLALQAQRWGSTWNAQWYRRV